jgi:hypothetical protein
LSFAIEQDRNSFTVDAPGELSGWFLVWQLVIKIGWEDRGVDRALTPVHQAVAPYARGTLRDGVNEK